MDEKEKPQKQRQKVLSEGDQLLTESMRWVTKLYIKVIEDERMDFLHRAGEYLYKKRNGKD